MKSNLIAIQNTQMTLNKSKSILGITQNILKPKKSVLAVLNKSWMIQLLRWADKNNIPELQYYKNGDYWAGLSRDKKILIKVIELDLILNNLQDIPKEIGNLVSLKELKLYRNQLRDIPEEISNLVNLRKLYLHKNELSSIPSSICNLVNLETLSLMFNNLQELPKEIGNLSKLKKLHLTGNFLTILPKSIIKLKNLTTLDLIMYDTLDLSEEQKLWLRELRKNGCKINIGVVDYSSAQQALKNK